MADDGVEAHARVADLARSGDDGFDELLSDVLSAELRSDVETLHLANAFAGCVELSISEGVQGICEGVQRDDAGGRCAIGISCPGVSECKQQTSGGRGVVAGESGEFGFEALKAKVEAERSAVFLKEFAGLRDVQT